VQNPLQLDIWGCGINAARWIPDKVGFEYDLKPELMPVEPFKKKVTVCSGFNCVLGGKPNLAHWSGLRVAALPMHHRDPFDRILIAQAQIEGLPLLTGDPLMARYDVELITA
jgi:hypothetical protein